MEAVGAQQDHIPRLEGDGLVMGIRPSSSIQWSRPQIHVHLGLDAHVTLEDVAVGMSSGLLRGQPTRLDGLLGPGVVHGELHDAIAPDEIGPGVPHVGQVEAAVLDHRQGDGGAHALPEGFLLALGEDRPVGLDDGLNHGLGKGHRRMLPQEPDDVPDGHVAGHLAGGLAADAIGHDGEVAGAPAGALDHPCLHRVLVVLPAHAGVGFLHQAELPAVRGPPP